MLKTSESMCKASLQEDEEVEEEDIDRETGIIRVQIAYAIQMQVQLIVDKIQWCNVVNATTTVFVHNFLSRLKFQNKIIMYVWFQPKICYIQSTSENWTFGFQSMPKTERSIVRLSNIQISDIRACSNDFNLSEQKSR